MKKQLLGLAASLVGVGVAFANPTIVAWENDFSTSKKDNVTLDLQGNAVDGDGGVTIGAKGIKLTRADNGFAGAASNAAVTVIVEASDITAAGTLGGVAYSATTDVTARRNSDGTLSTYWSAKVSGTSTKTLLDAGQHRLAFVCGNAGAELTGLHAYVDGEEWVSAPDTVSSANKIPSVLVGGNLDGSSVAAGMKVSRVAVVDGALTPAEVASYVWPSARNDYYDHFKANFSDRVISMTHRQEDDFEAYNFLGTLFDLETLADTSKTYNGSTSTTDLPGYNDETSQKTWNIFCYGQGGYVAPGCVMRIPPCSPGYSWQIRQRFNPTTFGGLIVEEGAVGTKIVDKMIVPGDIVQVHSEWIEKDGQTVKNARSLAFGDPKGLVPSWFVLRESFFADPFGGAVKLYGELNFDIAEGRVFHFQDVEDPPTITLDPGTSATLKMHGEGTLKLPTLTATGAGLDYSDLPVDREMPYIDGNIMINASTKITLPAALADGGWFKLCSGTVTATALPASVWAGEEEITDFKLVGNLIVVKTTTAWTGEAGDNLWATPENWSNGVPGAGAVADLRTVTDVISVESTDALAGVVALGPLWAIDGTTADGTLVVDGSALAASKNDGACVLRCTADEKPVLVPVNLGDKFRVTWNGDLLIATLATVTDEMLAVYRHWADYAYPLITWASSNNELGANLYSFDPILGVHTGPFTSRSGTVWHVFCQGTPDGWEPGAIFRLAPSFGNPGRKNWGMSPSAMGGFLIEPGATGYDISCGDSLEKRQNRAMYLGDYKNKVGETWSFIGEDFKASHGTQNINIYGVFNVEIAEGKVFTLKSALPAVTENATLKMHGEGTLKVEDRAIPVDPPPANAGLLQAVSGAGLDYSDLSADRATPYIDGGIVIDATTRITIPAAMADGGRFMLCSDEVVVKGLPASIRVGEAEVTAYALIGNEIVIGTTRWTNATGDNNWSTAANWSNGLPGEGSIVVFGAKDMVNIESADVFAGMTVAGAGWAIDGTVDTTTIDFAVLMAPANGTGLFRCTAAEKPSFTAVNLGDRFRATWSGDNFIATLATVTDETLAFHLPWSDRKANVYTWIDQTLSSHAKPFDPLLGVDAGEEIPKNAWHIFCGSQAEYESNAVMRLAPKTYATGLWAVSPLCVSAFAVEPGAVGFDLSAETSNNRHDYFGDYKNNVAETWSVIGEDFTVSHGIQNITFCGVFNLDIAEGKTFTIKSTLPGLRSGATLKMHGAGTLKVELRTEDGKEPAEGDGVFQAVENAGLDFSDLSLDREAPFIDGDLKVDETTRFTFPAGLESGVAYPLCSGTLTAPQVGYLTKIAVGDEVKTVILGFTGNAAVYRDDAAACVDGSAFYDTVQKAVDAAGANSVVDVLVDGAVTLSADKTLKTLNLAGSVTFGGRGALTLADGGSLNVAAVETVTVNTPLVLAGVVRKLGAGAVMVNGSVANGVADGMGDLAVCAGTADFDGAITGVMIRGCGTDADNWPVITLKANCTVSDQAVVSPVRCYPATGDAKVKCYGMLVQNGAAYSYHTTLGLMRPNNGAGRYVLNSGTLTVASSLCLQDLDNREGQMAFEMNGGEVTATEFNMCRTGTSNNDTYRGLLVLNDGCFSVGDIRSSSNTNSAGVFNIGWQEHKRIELNGGTFDIRGKTLLFDTNLVWVVASGDITLANSAGTTTVVPDCLAGMDSLTFAGAGTLDVSGLPAGTCDDYAVTGGQLLLGDGNISETTTLKASGTGKFGLKFEGEKDVKALYTGGRIRTKNYVYGYGRSFSARFVETDPCGCVRTLEGKDESGAVLLVR